MANAKALAVFGINASSSSASSHMRTVREGTGVTIFTIGYERRDGDELVSLLRDAGVEVLADVREKPTSRKPDFRPQALQARCRDAGIEYVQMPELGSSEGDREALRSTGDIEAFHRRFRAYAKRHLSKPLGRLAELVKQRSVALLCYERSHEDCHRSIVADCIAERSDASIVAII